jgi:hypothetical protein
VATIGVAGRHRSLRLSRSAVHADPRADVRRAWLAPLLALLAIGLLPVLGHSLVWLGTAATDSPTDRTATATTAPPATAAPTPSATGGSTVAAVPSVAEPSPDAAPSSSPRVAPKPRSSAPPSVAVAPPVVVVPTDQNPDPATVQQPNPTPQDPTSDVGSSGTDPNSAPDSGPDDTLPPECTADCVLTP